MNKDITRFNVRVYFILLDEEKRVLVSDEIIRGSFYTKFPGGGLEFGEGTKECVEREAMEELGQAVEVLGHFYTSDFFIQSMFHKGDQVLAIYYTAKLKEPQKFKSTDKKFDFIQEKDNEESFRWVNMEWLKNEEFFFPSDKEVIRKLLKLT